MSYSYNNNWLTNSVTIPGGASVSSQSPSSGITVSLGNVLGAQGSGYSGGMGLSFNDDIISLSSNVKKYEVFETSQDLLALSVCWARHRKTRNEPGPQPTITKLLDSELFRLVTGDDIDNANTIRDYYSKKIMVWKLKSIILTNYRQDLNSFIHSDGKTFKENIIPLVYRLPEFYDYDVEFEKMSMEYNKEIKRQSSHVTERHRLTFVKSLPVNTKRLKKIEYWFSDINNNLIQMNIESNNPLNSLLEKIVTTGSIDVAGRYSIQNRDGNEFLRVDKYQFV